MNKIIHGPNVAGQSIADRVMAAKHSITGQEIAKAVFKATTDEVMGPKRKHLDCKTTPISSRKCGFRRSGESHALS